MVKTNKEGEKMVTVRKK
ncbi:unnamed protein product [Nezara viridula]|uniref:Uncharacterized protein n=1 Tax=Nezara viridula TaxID=85310 RepID=A0A9P0E9W3_NEZVI|nr:unnamed protein product [Nezara viridula]